MVKRLFLYKIKVTNYPKSIPIVSAIITFKKSYTFVVNL
ncbi:protein of unknown function [Tenacibaculum sp. 190524A02b]|uniref:Uncharacterized protein n=1 Tax=Tenacibaculum vairaonense TaxID=3137860 RepID=A0ABM9PMW6_9FLAO